eukprot:scaffold31309_cov41-Phaeocystis_antarctica.AAC.4
MFFRVAPSAFFLGRECRNGNVSSFVLFFGVEGGGLALCPVGCGALVVSCPPEGRISILLYTSSGCLAHLRGPFSSHQDQRSRSSPKVTCDMRREKNNYPEVPRGLWVGGRQEEEEGPRS